MMFRRKKSQDPAPVKQISISAPRSISAQLPPPSSPTGPTPLYERFAKTSNAPSDANVHGSGARPAPVASVSNLNSRAPSGMRPRVSSTSGGGGRGSARPRQVSSRALPALNSFDDAVRQYLFLRMISTNSMVCTGGQCSTAFSSKLANHA